ncbi:MAG TPA: histidine phosphatase family protein [Candidatus Saccharimonadales bacterium]|nr:histidine phosphatase family protein [Candidatus Saccharimonadales bacterium]
MNKFFKMSLVFLLFNSITSTMIFAATEFYFVRHGQTNMNLKKKIIKQHFDAPLNPEGQQQIEKVTSYIETLPIKTICYSPLLRAQQTKDIINRHMHIPEVAIPELAESSRLVWAELSRMRNRPTVLGIAKGAAPAEAASEGWDAPVVLDSDRGSRLFKISLSLQKFLNRVDIGLDKVLQQPSPALIVAHSGVFMALCKILHIIPDQWLINNGTLVHFYKNKDGKWNLKHLFDVDNTLTTLQTMRVPISSGM